MQVRKRAKTITFGRKKKEEPEEAETPVEATAEPAVDASEKTEEKAETVERRSVAEKPQLSSELSETLPAAPEEEEAKPAEQAEDNATPAEEFVTDDQPAATPEAAAPEVTEVSAEEPKPVEPVATEVSPPPEVTPETSASPEEPATAPAADLSPTTPETPAAESSAFSIQNDEKATAPEVVGDNGGKKRFGLYFFLVAFLAFVLGLGAMAALSYGWVTIPGVKIPTNLQVQVPGLGATPTAVPAPTEVPTVAPTEKPADLTAHTIAVLNGSGVVGKASEVKTTLTTAGFKVSTTGNADKNDYTKTEISAKKSVDKAYLAKLEEELKKSFDVAEVKTAPESDTTDVTVIIGTATAK